MTRPTLPEACEVMLEGAGQPRVSRGSGGAEGHRAVATLTCAGSGVHEGAIASVMEEEIGPILVVTKDIRGTAAEDRAHADTPAAWKRTLNHSRW